MSNLEFPPGAHWAHIRMTPENISQIDPYLIALLVKGRRGDLHEYAGTAFIVHSGNRFALALTANHVLDEVRNGLQLRECENPDWRAIPRLADRVRNEIKTAYAEGRALAHAVAFDGQADLVKISMVSTIYSSDLALIGLQSRIFTGPQSLASINSDLDIELGTQAFIPSLSESHYRESRTDEIERIRQRNWPIAPEDEKNVMTFERKVTGRVGTITERLANTPYVKDSAYRLSMPIPPGMSGSPVFIWPPAPYPVAIGICSHCDSTKAEWNDGTFLGRGVATAIRTVLALSVTPRESVLDFVRAGAIVDVGSNWKNLDLVEEGDVRRLVPRIGVHA